MSSNRPEFPLSIIITVVGGKQSLLQCLNVLYPQAEDVGAELIVPLDRWTTDVLQLAEDFPNIKFVDAGVASSVPSASSKAFRHSNFDLRRAAGLSSAGGAVIAMTEDYAIPGPDWCRQILEAHDEMKDSGVIGGAIENKVDRTLNWVWYYSDFGRYGRPFVQQEVEYVSDVNVSYKREAIMSVKDLWETAFHETTVHWSLNRSGVRMLLDPRFVVFQNRPSTSICIALRERVEWGRAFAETRIGEIGTLKRLLFAVGCSLLPLVLYSRAIKHMIRHDRSWGFMVQISPVLLLLLLFWSVGEAVGYLNFPRSSDRTSLGAFDASVSSS